MSQKRKRARLFSLMIYGMAFMMAGCSNQSPGVSDSINGDHSPNTVKEEQHNVSFPNELNPFESYSDEEIISRIADRYGDQVSFLEKERDKYYFQADGFTFSAINDFEITDDYEDSYFAYLAQQFSYEHNRITEFEKSEDENGESVYVPIVGFHGRQPGETESFSKACCDLVEQLQKITGFEKIGYFSEERRQYFDITPYLETYDRIEFYNAPQYRTGFSRRVAKRRGGKQSVSIFG